MINRDNLTFSCGSETYSRGEHYHQIGRVKRVEPGVRSEQTLTFLGVVSGGSDYRVLSTFNRTRSGDYEVGSTCSCPVGFNCKHGVALALAAISPAPAPAVPRRRPAPPDRSHQWLDDLTQAAGAPERETAHKLLYLLKPGFETRQLILNVVLVRELKKGGYGVPSRVDWQALTNEYYSHSPSRRYATAEDIELAHLFRAVTDLSTTGDMTPTGEIGAFAMHKAITTGRCHWRDKDSAALTWGGPRALSFEWRDRDDAFELTWKTDPPAGYLIPTEPPLYLDGVTFEVGETTGMSVGSEQLRVLLRAPLVHQDGAEAFSRHWVRQAAELDIAPPTEVEVIDLVAASAVPQALITSRSDPTEQIRYEIEVSLRYRDDAHPADDITLPLTSDKPVEVVERGSRLLRLHRDAAGVAALRDRLESLGLVHAGRNRAGHDRFGVPKTARAEGRTVPVFYEILTRHVPELEADGWVIQFAPDFNLEFRTTGDDWWADVTPTAGGWFDLSLAVDIDRQRLHILPMIAQLLEQSESIDELVTACEQPGHTLLLKLDGETYASVSGERLAPFVRVIGELISAQIDGDALRLSKLNALQLHDLEALHPEGVPGGLSWRGGEELRTLGRRLADFDGIDHVPPAPTFRGQLREYQQHGLNWLQFLRQFEFGGVLADDMGLGKTVQVLAHLQVEKTAGRLTDPCLVVAPTSVLGNWRREAARFTPELRVLTWHGPDRRTHENQLAHHDVILTTYSLLSRDAEILTNQHYHVLVADEAHRVKNPKTATARALRSLPADSRVCLTGTPLENHLGELWAIFDFLMPSLLGPHDRFNKSFRNPVERNADTTALSTLQRRISPFLLRRNKADVAAELPEKTQIVRTIELTGPQRELYESIRVTMEKRVRDAIAANGLGSSHITILDALLKLRQVCCDPRLVKLESARRITHSAKLEALDDLLDVLLKEQRRILLFSQFTEMLGLIEESVKASGISYTKLTGQTRDRDAAIDSFKRGDADLFLISLKAGGVGLNLTEADTVIHYDPWWNPAVEDQATDRAHRIGQTRNVFVYKLVIEDSVEERILEMQDRKAALADSVYSDLTALGRDSQLTRADLEALFQPLPDIGT